MSPENSADSITASMHSGSSAAGERENFAQLSVGQGRLSHIADDDLTFAGAWTAEVLARSATHFDVPAAAVRRRMAA